MFSLTTRKQEAIYVNPEAQVTVYKGVLEPGGTPVAIKEQLHGGLDKANAAILETMAQVQLSHPWICKVFTCSIEEADVGTYRSTIVTELLTRDLFQEIESRRHSSHYWSASELTALLRGLVSALSLAQRCGISHRDIKPQNIFVGEDTLKIGDFGSSAMHLGVTQYRASIQGSPFFLSPELKQAYIVVLSTGEQPFHYDPVKSDVYSLGVTLLFMATLEPPTALMNLGTLAQATEEAIGALDWCPSLQAYLRYMLAVEPDSRPTFQQLDEWLSAGWAIPSSPPIQPLVPFDPTSGPAVCCICSLPFISSSDTAKTCSYDCEKQRCLCCSERISDIDWIAQNKKQGKSLKKRCCSQACYTSLVKDRTRSCVFCPQLLDGDVKKTAMVLSCAHAFHSQQCFAAFCRKEASEGYHYCPACSVPIKPALLRQYSIPRAPPLCSVCNQSPAPPLRCGHSLCQKCRETQSRGEICFVCYVLEESKEAIEKRFQPLFEQLTVSQNHLKAMSANLTSLLQKSPPEDEKPPPKPKPPPKNAVFPAPHKPTPTTNVYGPRKSVPTLLVSTKINTPRKSAWASRNQMIAAAAAATTRRKAEDLSLKAKIPSHQAKRPAGQRKTVFFQSKPSHSSSKKTDELSSLPSISEFSGTEFQELDDIHDVSGVSPIERGEANSRASVEDIAIIGIIEQELAALHS